MKNRFLLIALAIVMLVVLVGCPSDKKEDVIKATAVTSPTKVAEIPKDLKMPAKPDNFVSKVNTSEEAYALFSEVINTFLGKEVWTQKEYSYNEKDALLTVKNFSVDSINTITAEEIYFRTALSKEEMVEILTLKNWKNKPETELYNFLGFKNVEIKKNDRKLDLTDETIDVEATMEAAKALENLTFNVEKLYSSSLRLKEVGDITSDNELKAFLSILKLGKSESLNSKMTFNEPGKNAVSIVVAYDEVSNMEFNTKNDDLNKFLNKENIDLPEEAKILLACAMDSRTVKGLDVKFEFKNLDGITGNLALSLANFEMKGISSILKGESLNVNNLKMNFLATTDLSNLDKTKDANITMSLESSSLKNYNMLNFLNDFSDVASVDDIENPFEVFTNTPGFAGKTFGDLLFGAFSLESMNMKNIKMDFGGGLKLDVAEVNQIGPNVASAPADASATVKDLVFTIPNKEGTLAFDKENNFYNFGRDFGMTEFVVNSVYTAKFDAAKETYVYNLEKCEVKDLINLKIEMSLGSLNKENIANLQKYNLANYALLFVDDSEVDVDADTEVVERPSKLKALGSISFNNLSYRIEDLGLVDKMMNFVSVSNFQGSVSKDDVKGMAIGGLAMAAPSMAQSVENPSAILNSVKTFLEETKGDGKSSIEIKVNPTALTVQSIFDRLKDYQTIDLLNDLKITITGNDKEAVDVKFLAVIS